MFNAQLLRLLAVSLAALVIAGCASTEPAPTDTGPVIEDDAGLDTAPPEVAPEPPPPPEPKWRTNQDGVPINKDIGLPLATTFYFDFDKAIVKREAIGVLAYHAEYLRDNPDVRVVLEGHCDERGTREYNLALGERRANAVRDYLVAQGVSRGQIETVSYGEERPAVVGHDEDAWSKNRRVEMNYR